MKKFLLTLLVTFFSFSLLAGSVVFATTVDSGVTVDGGTRATGVDGGTTGTGVDGGTTGTGVDGGVLVPITSHKSLCALLASLITILTEIGAIIGALFLIWSGFRFIVAQGNKIEMAKAKATLFNTLLGVSILLGASVLVQVIIGTISTVLGTGNGICSI
jgi:hypothetical protein